MGILDRFNRDNNQNQRKTDIVGHDGQQLTKIDYTGVWASKLGASGAANNELKRLKPDADDATNISAVAARCIDLIVDNLASRDIVVTTKAGEETEHFLERLLNESPNNSQSARLFKKSIWYRIYNHGEALVILDRGPSRVGEPKSAHLHYGNARVRLTKPTVYAPQGEIQAYEIELDKGVWIPLAPSEVLWLREPDPKNPWKSRAPMEAALDSIGLANVAKGWQAGQLLNGANPSGIVYLGQPDSDEDMLLAADEIEHALTGPSSAGRIALIAGPVEPKFIQTSLNATEVAYLDTLKLTDEQIANALGVPLDLIGGQRTYQNLESAWRILWEGTLLPRLELIASEINRQILSNTDLSAVFDISDIQALQEGRNAITERVAKATELDIITIDEARYNLGFEPLPNGLGNQSLSAYKASLGIGVALPAARSVEEIKKEEAYPSSGNTQEVASERIFDVPQYIQDNAARGLRYLEEGFGGDGLTEQTIAEAKDMANGFISEDKVARMGPWIARHLGDLDADKNNDPENPEYPGAGLVAHLLWGSGPDKQTANRVRRWAERKAAEYNKKTSGEGLHTRGLEPEEAIAILDKLEEQARRVVRRLADAQLKDALKRLQRGERDNTIPASANATFNPAAWVERAYEYLLPAIANALENGYTRTTFALGIQKELAIDNYITIAADERAAVLVEQVNSTTAKILQDRLTTAAIADRVSVEQYKEILTSTFSELKDYRAEAIARTEMLGSFNSASHQAAVDTRVPVAREWLAIIDGRTRSSHILLDGERTTSMSDPYTNGLLYPGDPNGDPGETINCRCVELYVTDYTEGNEQ